MYHNFKPGDIVICIENFFADHMPVPQKGGVYTVSSSTDACGCGRRIEVEEVPSEVTAVGIPTCCACNYGFKKGELIGWGYTHFRKLVGTDIDVDMEEVKKLFRPSSKEQVEYKRFFKETQT